MGKRDIRLWLVYDTTSKSLILIYLKKWITKNVHYAYAIMYIQHTCTLNTRDIEISKHSALFISSLNVKYTSFNDV